MVREVLEPANWKVAAEQRLGNGFADLVLRHGNNKYIAEVRVVPHGSSAPLEDYWSGCALKAKHIAQSHGVPLAIIVAPKVSPAAVTRLYEFAKLDAPEVAVAVIDQRGLQEFQGPRLESLSAKGEHQIRSYSAEIAPRKNLFSDLNQWLLKVLFAPELPERFISAPCSEYRNATELAGTAGCSVMSAHRFMALVLCDGFLTKIHTVNISFVAPKYSDAGKLSGRATARAWRCLLLPMNRELDA